jgi:hypothetical protein
MPQPVACSWLVVQRKVSHFTDSFDAQALLMSSASKRGRIKIQEDHSPKSALQVRNFAQPFLRPTRRACLQTTKSTRVSGVSVSMKKS